MQYGLWKSSCFINYCWNKSNVITKLMEICLWFSYHIYWKISDAKLSEALKELLTFSHWCWNFEWHVFNQRGFVAEHRVGMMAYFIPPIIPTSKGKRWLAFVNMQVNIRVRIKFLLWWIQAISFVNCCHHIMSPFTA